MSEAGKHTSGETRPTAEAVASGRFQVPADRPRLSQRGLPAAPGIAIGRVRLHTYARIAVREHPIAPELVHQELDNFRRAIDKSREEVAFLRDSLAAELGEESARIFDAQLLFFEDVMVLDGTTRDIEAESKNAASIFRRNVNRMIGRLQDADSPYLRERAADFQDAKRRVLRHLLEVSQHSQADYEADTILLARDLAPSEAAALDPNRVAGLVTESGALTSHAAIMARTKGIPAVVGVPRILRYAQNGDVAALDGQSGVVELNPLPSALKHFEVRLEAFRAHLDHQAHLRDLPAMTQDGHAIELVANIESPDDAERVLECGAAGVGLYRTEFFYIDRARMPTEDEQFIAYNQVAERLAPHPVTIRTMDVGGDKVASYLGTARENNPFLGWRGIRYSLERRDVLRTQLRAIYRASARGNVRVLLPMISSVDEVREARGIVGEVVNELEQARVPVGKDVPLGIMIETPAAVAMADLLAREADFFSVGSNDLIQYVLAVDRTNPKTAHLYEPLHPAMLRTLRAVVGAAQACKIPVGVCGEMAADPLALVVLVGLGFHELSATPYSVPDMKEVVRAITLEEAREAVALVEQLETAKEVRARLSELLAGRIQHF